MKEKYEGILQIIQHKPIICLFNEVHKPLKVNIV